jgi:hypothetical protein
MDHMGKDVNISFFPINQLAVEPDFAFAEHIQLLGGC